MWLAIIAFIHGSEQNWFKIPTLMQRIGCIKNSLPLPRSTQQLRIRIYSPFHHSETNASSAAGGATKKVTQSLGMHISVRVRLLGIKYIEIIQQFAKHCNTFRFCVYLLRAACLFLVCLQAI